MFKRCCSLTTLSLLAGVALAPPMAATEHAARTATAELADRQGNAVGSVELRRMPNGTLVHARLDGLPPGTHAFHVHGTGVCEPPFESAGGHFDPDGRAHGFAAEEGPHAGDLPNIHVPASGALEVEMFSSFLRLDQALLDADGAAIVIHAGPDDYTSQPAGAAGERIACGVIEVD